MKMTSIATAQSFHYLGRDDKLCTCGVCEKVNGDYATQIVREERDNKMGRTPKIVGKPFIDELEEPRTPEYSAGQVKKTRIGCLSMLIQLPIIALYYLTGADIEREASQS